MGARGVRQRSRTQPTVARYPLLRSGWHRSVAASPLARAATGGRSGRPHGRRRRSARIRAGLLRSRHFGGSRTGRASAPRSVQDAASERRGDVCPEMCCVGVAARVSGAMCRASWRVGSLASSWVASDATRRAARRCVYRVVVARIGSLRLASANMFWYNWAPVKRSRTTVRAPLGPHIGRTARAHNGRD